MKFDMINTDNKYANKTGICFICQLELAPYVKREMNFCYLKKCFTHKLKTLNKNIFNVMCMFCMTTIFEKLYIIFLGTEFLLIQQQ
jgi:hypothetical protein